VRQGDRATLLLTNHALPRQPIEAVTARVELANVPPPRAAWVERIDERHANARRAWQEMGAPEYLGARDVERLEEASRLVRAPQAWRYEGRAAHVDVELPPHAVAAVTLEFAGPVGPMP
jgi:xylan 1,4-beta-xylosidase